MGVTDKGVKFLSGVKNVLKLGSLDYCTTLSVYLTPLNCALKSEFCSMLTISIKLFQFSLIALLCPNLCDPKRNQSKPNSDVKYEDAGYLGGVGGGWKKAWTQVWVLVRPSLNLGACYMGVFAL